ncbi:MAG: hypothetical protein JWL60_613 [Gemmatimonadetes bacterium]|jgi:hypothetical protein|nr:hypothetical protein [Gemmatimonadota bacterium]
MKKTCLALLALGVVASSAAEAQSCTPTATTPQDSITVNTRRQAEDLFQFVAPQLAQAVAGGSATLGQNSTLGGLGHFSLGVHGTVVAGSIPDVGSFPTCYNGSRRTALPTSKSAIPMVGADAAIGVFGGLPLALTSVGAIDLLLSAQYVPEKSVGDVSVLTPDGALQIGYGARLGLLSESILVPGVSLSYMKRDLPRLNVTASAGNNELAITGLKVKTSSWRLAASKNLLLLSLGAGVGRDRLESRVDSVTARVPVPTALTPTRGSIVNQQQALTRTNYFANVSFSLLVAKIVAEVGQSTGGTAPTTFNTFAGAQPTGARTYGSLGVRFGL